jgi:hypothetical protein
MNNDKERQQKQPPLPLGLQTFTDRGDETTDAMKPNWISVNIVPDCKYSRMHRYILDVFSVFPDADIGAIHTMTIGTNKCTYECISNVMIELRSNQIADSVKSLLGDRHDEFRDAYLDQQRRSESGLSVVDWNEHRRRLEKNPFTLPEAINGFDWGVVFLDPRPDGSNPLVGEILDQTLRIIADTEIPVEIRITYDIKLTRYDGTLGVKVAVPLWLLYPSPEDKLTIEAHHLTAQQIFGGTSLRYSPLSLRVNVHDIHHTRTPS